MMADSGGWRQTQIGGFVENVDVERIDYIVAETGTSRIAVLRAMIRCCIDDVDSFIEEWMPKREAITWELGGDPYTEDARRARRAS